MRKYFLLTAAALLAASTANATTDYAEVTARAKIEVANQHTCSNLDFGTIVVKKDNPEITLYTMMNSGSGVNISYDNRGDVISISGDTPLTCNWDASQQPDGDGDTHAELTNANGDKMDLIIYWGGGSTEARLIIPANVKAGVYEGSFTFTMVYES